MDQQNSTESASAAPLYITIGPPACGKTTWLKHHQVHNNDNKSAEAVLDIAIDDQQDVYIPIDTRHYYGNNNQKSDNDDLPPPTDSKRLDENWFGKTLRQHIEENQELQLVAQRSAGLLSFEEWDKGIRNFFKPEGGTVDARIYSTVLACYETVWKDHGDALKAPPQTDLYVLQCIFKPHPVTQLSAIDAARQALDAASPLQSVACGNTNTKATDYQSALKTAARQGRPVEFVVYPAGQDLGHHMTIMETDLPAVGYEGLLTRNLHRYLATGRYVPAGVIWDMLERTYTLLDHVRTSNQPSTTPSLPITKLERDQILASLAGFTMSSDRRVMEDPNFQQHNNNQRQYNRGPRPQGSRQQQQQQQRAGNYSSTGHNNSHQRQWERGGGGRNAARGRGRGGRSQSRGGGRGHSEYYSTGRNGPRRDGPFLSTQRREGTSDTNNGGYWPHHPYNNETNRRRDWR